MTAETADEKKRWVEALRVQIEHSTKDGGNTEDKAALWKPDNLVQVCMNCGATRFSAFNRRVSFSSGSQPFSFYKTSFLLQHHCRGCGKVVCAACSESRIILPHLSQTKPVRVCIACYGSGLATMKQSTFPIFEYRITSMI